MPQVPVLQLDGSVVIGTQRIQIPNARLDAMIGSGANGWVFRGTNPYLDRVVAVKIWMKLRPIDDRDKFLQGVAEAKKTAHAAGEHVILVLDAGEVSGYFYTLMEYFPGITLGKWLQTCHPRLSARWYFASALMWEIYRTTNKMTCHGDLHINNVLVAALVHERPASDHRQFAPHFKIIDFGTSIFTTSERSLERHWRVVNETFTRLLYPLNINTLAGDVAPKDYSDPHDVYTWYEQFLKDVPHMLGYAGVRWLQPLIPDLPSPIFPEPVAAELRRLVSTGELCLDVAWLGGFKEWYI